MHYRNGREAKNGDKVVMVDYEGKVIAVGVLHSATPGNDYCNGSIAPTQSMWDDRRLREIVRELDENEEAHKRLLGEATEIVARTNERVKRDAYASWFKA